MLLCGPAWAQPEAALKLWQSLQNSDAAAAAPLIQADPKAAEQLYRELYFEAADCKLYHNRPFSPQAEKVRLWLLSSAPESAQLEPLLTAEKVDFSGQTTGLGYVLKHYQQLDKMVEGKPLALAEAEKLQLELAIAALSVESDEAGRLRSEAIWKRWKHGLGLLLCDIVRGQSLEAQKDLAGAILAYEQAARGSPQYPKWRIHSLTMAAAVHKKLQQPVLAAEALGRATELAREWLKEDREDRLACWKQIANLETQQGGALALAGSHLQAGQCYARAEEARNQAYQLEKAELEQGLESAKKAATPQGAYIATDAYLFLLDNAASERNDQETLARVAERRIELARAQQDWMNLARALEAQAKACRVSRPAKARGLAQEAYRVREQQCGGRSLWKSLAVLADVAEEQSDWEACRKYYRQLIELGQSSDVPPLFDLDKSPENLKEVHKKSNLTDRQGLIQNVFYARLGLAQIDHNLANYRQAAEGYEALQKDLGRLILAGLVDEPEQLQKYQARRPTPTWQQLYEEQKKGPDLERLKMGALVANGLEAALITERARLLSDQGDAEGASLAYKAGIERIDQVLGGSFPLVGLYMALAGLEMDLGRLEAAEGPMKTALEQYVRAHDSGGIAGTLAQLSGLRRRQGRTLEAVELGRQGLELSETLHDPIGVANLARTLGLAEAQLGGNALYDSERHLRQAAEVFRRLGLRSQLANSLSGLGLTLERQGRDQEALASYQEAVGLVELMATQLTPTEAQNFNASRSNAELYDRLIRLLLKLGKPEESFRYLERFKSKSLMDSLVGLQIGSSDPKVKPLLSEVQELARQVRAAERNPAEQSAADIEALRTRYQEGVRRLQQADPSYAGVMFVGQPDLSKVRQRLPQDALLLEYFPTAEQLFIFAVTAEGGAQVFTSATPRSQLMGKVSQFRADIKDRKDTRELGKELYQMLLAPVQAPLSQARSLILVPGGELYHLPFQALVDGQGHYLVESKPVVYAAQADLLPAASPPPAARSSRLLALGNPDKSLPAASQEVAAIATLFPDHEVFLENRATLAQLARPRRAPAYLHLATHGTFNGLDPKESGLVLAGHPGQLRVRDLLEGRVNLPLNGNRLVTLSACQTHMGGNNPGALYGSLSRAFHRVGAPAVVASLWSVEDESTCQLMKAFYAQLAQGKPRGEALAFAQRQLLAKKEFAEPFFWAPFVLMGEWR